MYFQQNYILSGCFTTVEVNVAATWNGMPIGNLKFEKGRFTVIYSGTGA